MDSAKPPATWLRPASLWLAPALLLALGVLIILFNSFGIQAALSNRLFDGYQRHAARPFADKAGMPVRVMELPRLDEDSLVGVTRNLTARGVRMILLTSSFEPGPSPQSLSARLPPDNDVVRAALATLPEPGHDLATALAGTKAVVPVMLGMAGRVPHIKARFVYRGTRDPFGPVPRFETAAAVPALLETSAAGAGAAILLPDADGVVRRMPVAFHVGTALVPGIAAEALRVIGGKTELTVVSDEHDPLSVLTGIGIAALEGPQGPIATGKDGQVRLRFAGDVPQRRLNPDSVADLNGAIVVIGAQGRMVQTPLGPVSIATVTAEGLENLLAGTVLVRPSWMRPLEALLLAGLGAAMLYLLRFSLGWAAALTLSASLLLGMGSWYLYAAHGLLVDAATPALLLMLAFAAGAALRLYDLKLAHAALRMAFSDSLPRAAIDRIARQPQLLKMDGETRTITYLVCGVEGLAGLADAFKNDAAGFTSLMERMLKPLMDEVSAHGGTLDRLTADGFSAFWNAPLDDADHALHACGAANAMAAAAARISDEMAQKGDGLPRLEIGVGIASGPVIAGGFSGQGRMGYSVHGEVVSLARRIQTLAHHYGPTLIVSDATKRLAERGFAFLEIDAVADGAQPATALYALMGNPVTRASPKFRALTVFHDHIFQAIRKQNWRAARELIAQCRRLSGASQKLYDLHLTRIAYYETHPPGADWDGAFRPVLE